MKHFFTISLLIISVHFTYSQVKYPYVNDGENEQINFSKINKFKKITRISIDRLEIFKQNKAAYEASKRGIIAGQVDKDTLIDNQTNIDKMGRTINSYMTGDLRWVYKYDSIMPFYLTEIKDFLAESGQTYKYYGNKIVVKYYSTQNIDAYEQYLYDKNGFLKSNIYYTLQGKDSLINYKKTYSYNLKGLLIECKFIMSDVINDTCITTLTKYIYNDKDELIQIADIDSHGKISRNQKSIFYDKVGNNIVSVEYVNGFLVYVNFKKYDDNRILREERGYDHQGILKAHYIYKYEFW